MFELLLLEQLLDKQTMTTGKQIQKQIKIVNKDFFQQN